MIQPEMFKNLLETCIYEKQISKTLIACYLVYHPGDRSGLFAPLLALTFHRTYQISLGKIAFISTAFFSRAASCGSVLCEICVDRIGYRRSRLLRPQTSVWLWIDRTLLFYGTSSGFIRYYSDQRYHLCDRKWPDRSAGQSHCRSLSFRKQRGRNEPSAFLYCWGSVGVILLSTIRFPGSENWHILACIWA